MAHIQANDHRTGPNQAAVCVSGDGKRVPRYCGCCSNRTGAQIIAVCSGIIDTAWYLFLGIVAIIAAGICHIEGQMGDTASTTHQHNATMCPVTSHSTAVAGLNLFGALHIIAAMVSLIGAVCLFIGARYGKPSCIMVWIILALVDNVLELFVSIASLANGTKHAGSWMDYTWVGVGISCVLAVWSILVASGARREVLGTTTKYPRAYIV